MNLNRTLARWAAGTALTAIWATAAAAQDTSVEASDTRTDGGAGSELAQDEGIAAITVTAQRRSQNMQEVPISITAADGETLTNLGIRTTGDLGSLASGLTFAVGLGGGAPTVRGVGGTGAGTDESANALYIDGVYMPSPQAMVFQFNNIERVEVLKGPQGTLFGRNASGGLIQVITKTPRNRPEARLEVGYANYDTFRAAGSVSGGLTDTLAVSVSGVFEDQRDGWGHNFTTGQDAYKGRFYGGHAKVVWDAGPDTTVTGSALYAYTRTAGTQGGQILPGQYLFGGGTALGFYDLSIDTPAIASNTDRNFALTIKHDFDWATLTSITSRDVSESRLIADADLGPVNQLIVDLEGPKKSWTQEIQLGSPAGSRLQWIIGAFYYHGDWYQAPSLTRGLQVAPLAFRGTRARQTTDSYAIYGQATYPVSDTTNLTAGLRYTIDERQHDVTRFTSDPATPPTIFPTENTEDKKLTWRFAIDHELTDDVLAYASYSRGFKSGLYNIGNAGNPPVRPQTIDAYEIGLKTDLFDRTVRLNLSAFRYDITDVQLRTTVPPNPTPIFYNAAKSRVYGAEAELEVYVSRRFTVRANAAYLSGEYTYFPRAVYFAENDLPGFGLTVLPPADASGNDTVFTPHWVSNVSPQYRLPTSIGDITLAGTWTYNSGFYFDPQNRTSNPSYHLLNATLTWEPETGRWVRLWVNNLADEQYYTTVQASNFGDLYFPAAPRTYGLTVGMDF